MTVVTAMVTMLTGVRSGIGTENPATLPLGVAPKGRPADVAGWAPVQPGEHLHLVVRKAIAMMGRMIYEHQKDCHHLLWRAPRLCRAKTKGHRCEKREERR